MIRTLKRRFISFTMLAVTGSFGLYRTCNQRAELGDAGTPVRFGIVHPRGCKRRFSQDGF